LVVFEQLSICLVYGFILAVDPFGACKTFTQTDLLVVVLEQPPLGTLGPGDLPNPVEIVKADVFDLVFGDGLTFAAAVRGVHHIWIGHLVHAAHGHAAHLHAWHAAHGHAAHLHAGVHVLSRVMHHWHIWIHVRVLHWLLRVA